MKSVKRFVLIILGNVYLNPNNESICRVYKSSNNLNHFNN